MAHNGLPTDANVSKLKIEKVSICFCCRASAEDRDHLFFEGIWAKTLWNQLSTVFGGSPPANIDDCMQRWLSLPRKPSYSNCLRIGLVCGGLHHIWRNRKHMVHDETIYPFDMFLRDEVRKITSLITIPIDEHAHVALGKLHFHSEIKHFKAKSWNPGTYNNCLNFASINAGDFLQYGAIIRNGEGYFVWAFSCSFPDNRDAEESLFQCLFKVLHKAKESGIHVDVIQSSNPLLSRLNDFYVGSSVHNRIEQLKREFGFLKCSRICSFLNQPAIAMAYLGEDDKIFSTEDDIPRPCRIALKEDKEAHVWHCEGLPCRHGNIMMNRRHEV